MILHTRKHIPSVLPSVVVNDIIINRVENSRFLDIMVDDHMKSKNHVELTPGKLTKYLLIQYKIRSFVPTKELARIY